MSTVTTPDAAPTKTFPRDALKTRLRKELKDAADESGVLHGDWDPVLDSLRVVSILLSVDDLFPGITLPPEKLIRPGGYRSVDDAVGDMVRRFQSLWNDHYKSRTLRWQTPPKNN
jgi:acyl carrier protein